MNGNCPLSNHIFSHQCNYTDSGLNYFITENETELFKYVCGLKLKNIDFRITLELSINYHTHFIYSKANNLTFFVFLCKLNNNFRLQCFCLETCLFYKMKKKEKIGLLDHKMLLDILFSLNKKCHVYKSRRIF